MVLRHLCSESEEESLITRTTESMVSPAPVKSKPLHNFALPLWNWSKDQQGTNAHTHIRSRKVTSPDYGRKSSSPLLYAQSGRGSHCKNSSDSGNRRCEGVKNACMVSYPDVSVEKSEKKSAMANGRSKLLIRFRTKNKADDDAVQDEGRRGGGGEEEAGPKTWNLRPRRAVCKRAKPSGEAAKSRAPPEIKNESSPAVHSRPELARCRSSSEPKVAEKTRKFTIPLSKEEIEEDIFVLTGSKPSRRPKKRPRTIQKQLDSVFPGLWLAAITPDSYRVPETPAKG